MNNQSYVSNQLFTENIKLNLNEINTKNLNLKLYTKICEKIENKCYKEGYILKNSIKLVNKNLGKFINIDTNNYISYDLRFRATIFKPGVGDILECYIDNINKLGIIAYIKYKDIIDDYTENNGLDKSPLIIIIPNESIKDIEKYSITQKIKIIVKAVRFKFNTNKIQLVGNIDEQS
jgi:DNA-directed RNA polymerase subunit E'/Rpb7|tara:strand:- start:289 stop:819 length:531 start_codon:yes stop_codon:yes gene_type:complete